MSATQQERCTLIDRQREGKETKQVRKGTCGAMQARKIL